VCWTGRTWSLHISNPPAHMRAKPCEYPSLLVSMNTPLTHLQTHAAFETQTVRTLAAHPHGIQHDSRYRESQPPMPRVEVRWGPQANFQGLVYAFCLAPRVPSARGDLERIGHALDTRASKWRQCKSAMLQADWKTARSMCRMCEVGRQVRGECVTGGEEISFCR
jgi:hypothetical protein